jgi:hypothetical protein
MMSEFNFGFRGLGIRGNRRNLHEDPQKASQSTAAGEMQPVHVECRTRCTEWRSRSVIEQFEGRVDKTKRR